MAEWLPIETAAKSREDEILLWFPWTNGASKPGCCMVGLWGYPAQGDDFGDDPCWIESADCQPLGDPSHWMPIPNPPTI